MENCLNIEGLSKSFRKHVVFKDTSLQMMGGNIYGLIGPNGSGKSVFLKIIAGLLKPDSGKLEFNNHEYTDETAYRINIGASIEKPEFIETISGFENLRYLAGIKKLIHQKTILNWMNRFDLLDVKDSKVAEYSLGMKQKLAIIQSLMEDQGIILLDEVSNSLDKKSKGVLLTTLAEERQKGKIIIYVNHNVDEVFQIADRTYAIEERKICPCKKDDYLQRQS